MSNLFQKYLQDLRTSDEKTIHAHSIRWAISLSVIILIFIVIVWGNKIFDFRGFSTLSGQNAFKEIEAGFTKTKNDLGNLKNDFNNIASSSLK